MRFLLVPILVVAHVMATCTDEFEKCSMDRDCCKGMSCVLGDWATSTNSLCLSHRSEKMNALDIDSKIRIVKQIVDRFGTAKEIHGAEAMTRKFDSRHQFAQLFVSLESKYGLAGDGVDKKGGEGKEEL